MDRTAQILGGAEELSFHVNLLQRERLRRANVALAQAILPSRAGFPVGVADIDRRLPAGGLETGLHEIAAADYRSLPAAWGFLLALVKTVAAQRRGLLFWPLLQTHSQDFGLPYGPGLSRFGLDPGRFLFARCLNARDALWAMEEGLRSGGLAAVLGARGHMDLTMSRRLQLAAESSGTPIFLLRAPRDEKPSAARTRWRVGPAPAARDRFGLLGHARWHVALERARGGEGREWIMEWNHEAFSLCLSSKLADRSVFPGEAKKSA